MAADHPRPEEVAPVGVDAHVHRAPEALAGHRHNLARAGGLPYGLEGVGADVAKPRPSDDGAPVPLEGRGQGLVVDARVGEDQGNAVVHAVVQDGPL